MAIKKGKRVTLFFAAGSGLTLVGSQGQTYAMHSFLQLCNAKEFKEGDIPLIRHIIFPQPMIPYLKKT
jgi:hypothetical protein